MKIRQGFVSNSSSSSFVLITTKENFEKVKATVKEKYYHIIDQLFEEDTLFGKPVLVHTSMNNQGYDTREDITCDIEDEDIYDDEDNEFDLIEFIDDFLDNVEKDYMQSYSTSCDIG